VDPCACRERSINPADWWAERQLLARYDKIHLFDVEFCRTQTLTGES